MEIKLLKEEKEHIFSKVNEMISSTLQDKPYQDKPYNEEILTVDFTEVSIEVDVTKNIPIDKNEYADVEVSVVCHFNLIGEEGYDVSECVTKDFWEGLKRSVYNFMKTQKLLKNGIDYTYMYSISIE